MLQRAGLAQALIADPSLLVLDEPMSGLDPIGRALVRDLILEERRAGKTVFFSSHILSDIEAICDRVAMIVRGELRGQGKVTDLVASAVQHVDIVVRKADAIETRKADADGVDAVIDAVRREGWSIVSVHAVSKSLEQVLLDEVERARPVDAKRMGVLA